LIDEHLCYLGFYISKEKKDMAKKKETVINMEMLTAIIAATQDATKTFLYVPAELVKPLVGAGLVEINEVMKTPEGNVPAKAIKAGFEYAAKMIAVAGAPKVPEVPKVRPMFTIEKSVPIPEIKRGGGKMETIYPFATMEIGDSFLIAKTAERPEPAKSLASTVASANHRFAVKAVDEAGQPKMRTTRKGKVVPVVVFTKVFVVRAVEGGARIWRQK
jgi:hypothetical protein